MSERSNLISKLLSSIDTRTGYIKAKLGVLVPSQIRALRISSDMPRQSDLANAAGLHQSRISMFETPGAANMTIETLCRLAAAFKVGLVVRFVPMSEMLRWETQYSQDSFEVVPLEKDFGFIHPDASWREESYFQNTLAAGVSNPKLSMSASVPQPSGIGATKVTLGAA